MSSRTRTSTRTDPGPLWRSRWVALGAAVAIVAGGGGVITAHAVADSPTLAFVPVVPCRLVDTRTGIGTSLHATPLNRDAGAVAFAAHGAQGTCHLPVAAAALMANITIVNPVTDGFLVAYSADETSLPVTSSINWVADQRPTGNQATIDLSPSGMFNMYASSGDVDVVVDVVGYYVSGSAGANGAKGADGTNGLNGPRGEVGETGAKGDPGDDGTDAVRGECTIGEISLVATARPIGSNMLVADGVAKFRTDYPDLFAVIGTTFGSPDDDWFSLPDITSDVVGLEYRICSVGYAPAS